MSDPELTQQVEQAIDLYEREIGPVATRTRKMIERFGEIQALSRLMLSGGLPKGFRILRERDELDQSVEAIVVRFQHLFTADVVESAQWRLDNPHEVQ